MTFNRNKKLKMNDQGMTLLELIVCFALLGILLVAAAQIISSASQIYYYTKSTSYGVQASQVVATEIRGDLENAVIQRLVYDSELPLDAVGKCFYISDDGKSVYFVNESGCQISYTFDETMDPKQLVRKSVNVYDESFNSISPINFDEAEKRIYTSKYVGMNYKVKDISFVILDKKIPESSSGEKLATSDYYVIELKVTVENPQYGEYDCIEYIPLFNYYGLTNVINIDGIIKGPHKTIE